MKVAPQDIRDVAEFAEHMALSSRIQEVLNNGPMTLPQIANIIEANKEVLGTTLRRMKDKGRVEKRGEGQWSLTEH